MNLAAIATPTPSAPAPSATPSAGRNLLMDLKRPGMFRADCNNLVQGDQVSWTSGFSGIDLAVQAAQAVLDPSGPSIVVIKAAEGYELHNLEQAKIRDGKWNFQPIQLPQLETRDKFTMAMPSVAAIVTNHGVIDRARIDA